MSHINFSDYTETEFLQFVTKICDADFPTEKEHTDAILLFKKVTEHPQGSDLIYYADSDEESTPEAIIEKVKAWRSANGKKGFNTDI
ncbi:bacteriocin immunity protein [Pseudomonas reinekei]|jgi:hypothetical protein|uniref:Bacteriocin immunity protein n=1 Tax=Pseudomonas reinekei TaxID=395598 RepID=A0A1Q9WS27_PSERE|nr:bacteriocin immunity protein [Pseudomonas reinekei]KAB0484704.1 bacteriocin immunity protein [Pseudomonas reinekei]OLU01513.1 bacteriocin immunity protein [Pseudomonas reinekei]